MNADRQYTLYPHLAGTQGEDRLGADIYDTWTQQGLDCVTSDTYNVLLSYPNRSDPNYVSLLDADGREVYRSQLFEKILSPDQNHSDVVPPFNAFSPPGDVKVRASQSSQSNQLLLQLTYARLLLLGHCSDFWII